MKQKSGIKPSPKTAREIISLITPEFLEPIIRDTGVDFHCRKLFGEVFLKLLILCQLLTSKGSQRKAAAVYSSELFSRLVPKADGTLTHTAVSRHLAACDPDFFERAYFKLLELAGPEPRGAFGGATICSVDSTMVRAVSRFISGREAMRVGAPGEGGMRPQIKYTMITDGISALYARLHTLPAYLSEDKALYEAVMGYAARMPRRGPDRGEWAREVFAFDRGLKGTTHLATMAGEGVAFVGRVAATRSFADAGGPSFPPGDLPEGVRVISDTPVRLPRPRAAAGRDGGCFDTVFRLLKADLGKEIGRRKGTAKRTETEIWILTDITDPALTSAELLGIYRERWKIEVFFRFLKQNLWLSHMMSLNENGLTIMMYVSLMTALLLELYSRLNGCRGENAKFRLELELMDDVIREAQRLGALGARWDPNLAPKNLSCQ